MEFPTVLGNSSNEPNKADTKKHQSPKSMLHQDKTKERQNVIARRALATAIATAMMTSMGS
jgi:hypothetical protein